VQIQNCAIDLLACRVVVSVSSVSSFFVGTVDHDSQHAFVGIAAVDVADQQFCFARLAFAQQDYLVGGDQRILVTEA